MGKPAPDDCPHLSLSGAEGPVLDLGRWPVLWDCDSCGMRVEYNTDPLLPPAPYCDHGPFDACRCMVP